MEYCAVTILRALHLAGGALQHFAQALRATVALHGHAGHNLGRDHDDAWCGQQLRWFASTSQ